MNTFLLSKTELYNEEIENLPDKKLLITTLNAYSFNMTQSDEIYAEAIGKSDILLPDGIGVVKAVRYLTKIKIKKIAGADLFYYEMNRLNDSGGTCFFLGSKVETLKQIRERAEREYPRLKVHIYSPPYKEEFSIEEDTEMLNAINIVRPDVLFIGLTAPKQEKWAYKHFNDLEVGHICCIGAVFDFYAGTVNRSPKWLIDLGLEWLYRLIKEPRRMWRRYLTGNVKFIWLIIREKIITSRHSD